MKIHDCIQGTTEWLNLRAGIPTASEFHRIVTPKKMEASKSQLPYMFELLAERLMGHPIEEHVSMWMRRGSAMERDAVQFYELQHDCDTTPVGFVTNDTETVGASPDRFVGDDGQLEIKVPSEAIHMAYWLGEGEGAYEAYKSQVQGQLWITGRAWCDVLSYHPELRQALVRIPRDDVYIHRLSSAVLDFSRRLEERAADLERKGWAAKSGRKPYTYVEAMRDSLTQLQQHRNQEGNHYA